MLNNLQTLINTDIILIEPGHRYQLKSNKEINFKSVTQLIDAQFKPFDKLKIARKLVSNFQKYKNHSVESLIKEWDYSRDRGSYIHKELQDYIEDGIRPRSNRGLAGAKWFKKQSTKFGDKVFPEVIIYDESLKIAGSVDLLIFNSRLNECYLFDWKTNKKIDYEGFRGQKGLTKASRTLDDCKYNKYSLQTSFYKYLLENKFNIPIKKTFLVHLTHDNNVDLIETDYLKHNISIMLSK